MLNLDSVSADPAESVDDEVAATPVRDVSGNLFRRHRKPVMNEQ